VRWVGGVRRVHTWMNGMIYERDERDESKKVSIACMGGLGR